MSRLWSSGFELNKIPVGGGGLVGVEWDQNSNGITAVTSPTHGGTYSAKVDGTHGTDILWHIFNTANGNGPYWTRVYLYVTAFPNVANSFYEIDAANGTTVSYITLGTSGALQLVDANNSNVGSSTTISLNTWYRVEMHVDMTGGSGHNIIEAALEGTIFASTNTSTVTQQAGGLYVGSALEGEALTSGTWYLDDVAINDNIGSFQNGYPGVGYIFHQQPAGAGDSTQWTIAGSSPAATNWQSVNETPPDDGITLVNESILNKSDFYTVGTSPMGASDTVNAVQVGARFNNDIADVTTNFQVQIEKTSSGTVTKSSSITPNTTTWYTNAVVSGVAIAQPYPITLYQDPDSSNWTKTTIESMQIGILAGTVGVHKVQVTNVWALVDYTPFTGPLSSSVSDSTSTSETVTARELSFINVSDSTTTSETISAQIISSPPNAINVFDSTTTSETITVVEFVSLSVSDATVTSETIKILETSFVAVSDVTTTSETITVTETDQILVSDSTVTSETLNELEASFIHAADSTTTSETLIFLNTEFISVSDATTTSVTVNIIIPLQVSVSDATLTSETLALSLANTIVVSDSTTTSETISIKTSAPSISVADSTTATETITMNYPVVYVSVADNTTTSENIAILTLVSYLIHVNVVLQSNDDSAVLENTEIDIVLHSYGSIEVVLQGEQ